MNALLIVTAFCVTANSVNSLDAPVDDLLKHIQSAADTDEKLEYNLEI